MEEGNIIVGPGIIKVGSLHHRITGAWSFIQSVVPQSDIQINHIHEFFVELQRDRVGVAVENL